MVDDAVGLKKGEKKMYIISQNHLSNKATIKGEAKKERLQLMD